MSRTTLCFLTAGILGMLSLGVAGMRYGVMGPEGKVPSGGANYKVNMVVRGTSLGEARLITACPLDFHRQHIYAEEYHSAQLFPKRVESRQGERRGLHWSPRVGMAPGPFQARYEFSCTIEVARPTGSMSRLKNAFHAAPEPGAHLAQSPGIDPGHPEIDTLAGDLSSGLQGTSDRVWALYQFVLRHIQQEPSLGGAGATAVECLQQGRGDALAKSRLLATLCRNRGIPARLVTGLALARRREQKAHTWVEAWVGKSWMPLCATHHHFGRVPGTYLVFGYGDRPLVRGKNMSDLNYACWVEHQMAPADATATPSVWQQLLGWISLQALPPAESKLVEFLLLLPLAALLICIFRNLIGLESFGTFAPALIGLAFRELESLPGILVFVSLVLMGWCMRRLLDRYHLLQVPRLASMLTLVVTVLIVGIVAANYQDLAATRYISLFPLVILTGMIERFWTMETEDSTWSSFKTLFSTLIMAVAISLVLAIPDVVGFLKHYPETLGLIMAIQLLIGRYTGYRLSELFRFREFLHEQALRGK